MLNITIDGQGSQKLAELRTRIANLYPAMLEIGEDISESTKQRFAVGVAPDGQRWEPNSPVTLTRKSGNRPLVQYGTLANSIRYQANNNSVAIGTNMEYARMMHYGGKKAQYPHLWGDIPGREFLGVSAADEQAIFEILEDYLDV